jgi:hypothetical protein
MKMNRELLKTQLSKILDSELSDSEIELALENAISGQLPYNHYERSPAKACKLDEPITFKLESMGTISEAVEKVDKMYTKRKLAFILVQNIIRDGEKETPIDLLESDLSSWIKKLYS